MNCEQCNAQIANISSTHSMVVVLQKVDATNGYSFFQCEQGALYQNVNFQHWSCSKAHMLQQVQNCINTHYLETSLIARDTTQVRLHNAVFNNALTCKQCGTRLTSVAYRFCLTHATPVNSVPDDSLNELGEWCCSLDHARQSVLKTVSTL